MRNTLKLIDYDTEIIFYFLVNICYVHQNWSTVYLLFLLLILRLKIDQEMNLCLL